MTPHPHNFGRYCKNGCTNYHIVNGDSACNVTGTRLTTTRLTVIYEVGCASYNCASHSSAQSEQEIRRDEREKVLDVLEKEALDWLNRVSSFGTSGERCVVGSFLTTIRGLRRGDEP